MWVEWVPRLVLSAALGWAAWADIRTQRIPAVVCWGLLAGGLVAEAARAHWASVALLGVLLLDADHKLSRPVTTAIAGLLAAMSVRAGYGIVTVTWLVVYLLWDVVPFLGGGDAQLLIGLSGLFPSPFLVGGWLAAQAVAVPAILFLRYRGSALRVVAQTTVNYLGFKMPAPAATRIPSALLVVVPAVIYLWARPV